MQRYNVKRVPRHISKYTPIGNKTNVVLPPIEEVTPGGNDNQVQAKGIFGKLRGAFAAGYAVGTWIDKKTGASDAIANGACKLTKCDK